MKTMNEVFKGSDVSEVQSFSNYETTHITAEMVDASYYGDYYDYSAENYDNIAGEVALWRGVLLQQLVNLRIQSENKKYNKRKREALKWFILKDNQKDVKQVCNYARYSYRQVLNVVKQTVESSKYLKSLKFKNEEVICL